jgi:membrane protein DedA with SNARE-associated domain
MLESVGWFNDSLADHSPAWLFLFLFIGTFVSEDASCLIAGASVAGGRISFAFAVVACLAGIFAGDMLLYGFGRVVGPSVFSSSLVRKLVSETNIERSRSWLTKNAAKAVLVSRFVSGLRLPTYLAAGALKANFARFAFYFMLAAAVWTPILVGAAAFSVSWVAPQGLAAGVIGLLVAVRSALKLTSWKNRRLAIGRLKRIANWEFWPLPVFYLPVACYVLYLGVKYRCFTLFTSVNPGMPAGGFVGESKDEIYNSLTRVEPARKHILRHAKICISQRLSKRLAAAAILIVTNDLSFPLIAKPDRGERGKGVTIVRDRRELVDAIRSADQDLILQEYFDGVEASVFYYRLPTSKRGKIFSITEKSFPEVTGDGVSTLEELILADARAVCMAKSYFKRLAGRLRHRPAKGERVQLIDIGTHSRGAIFREGQWLMTKELESRIDQVCRGIDGFFFGRFDIRAASFDDLMKGRNFKFIELNGVTSESTNIYDPRYNLIDAYRILFRQWRLAFEIGKINRDRGDRPLSIRELARLAVTRNASNIARSGSGKLVNIASTNACA